jgi:hypothetical protein
MSLNVFIKKFAVGIPIWLAVAFCLNFLNQPSSFSGWGDGAGAVKTTSIFQTKSSYFIIGYFLFSSIIAASVSTRRWRILFGVVAHGFLLASLLAAILPDFSSQFTDKATMETMILVPAYLIFFAPWSITWFKFVKAGSIKV